MVSQMPWDRLRGDTIRQVIKELGFSYQGLRRDEMVEYLEAVESEGLDAVLASQEERRALWEIANPRAKRPRLTGESPSKMATRGVAERRSPSRAIFDCVLVAHRPSMKARSKGKGRSKDKSHESGDASPPYQPPSSTVSEEIEMETEETSQVEEEELAGLAVDVPRASKRSPLRSAQGAVKTYAGRKPGRRRKSAAI